MLNVVIGAKVIYENDHGPQNGTVTDILRNINNGQQFAIVEIDNDLPGIFDSVALASIRVTASSPMLTPKYKA